MRIPSTTHSTKVIGTLQAVRKVGPCHTAAAAAAARHPNGLHSSESFFSSNALLSFSSSSFLSSYDQSLVRQRWNDKLSNGTRKLQRLQFASSSSSSSSSSSLDVKNVASEQDVQELIFQSLDEHDIDMFEQLMSYKERHGDCHVPAGTSKFAVEERQRLHVSNELAQWVGEQRKALTKFIKQNNNATTKRSKTNDILTKKMIILDSMGFLLSEREAQWQRQFNQLEAYVKENSHSNGGKSDMSNINEREIDFPPQLISWMGEQRKAYKRGTLSSQRLSLLQELNFVFDIHETNWWNMYQQLVEYKEKYGHTAVPVEHNSKDITDDDDNDDNDDNDSQQSHAHLGQWVARQRRRRTSNQLDEKRIKALDEIDFSWDLYNESWENYYQQLKDFYHVHGHTKVPLNDEYVSLFRWIDRQRRFLRAHHIRSTSSSSSSSSTHNGKKEINFNDNDDDDEDVKDIETRMELFNKLGFNWDDDDDNNNDDKSKANNNDDDDDDGNDEDNTNKKSNVLEDRVNRLLELPFQFIVHDETWLANFRRLIEFKDRHGHLIVPSSDRKYQELETWVRHQRYQYKRDKLSANRTAALDSIGFGWSAATARWEHMYERLVRYHAEHGHTKLSPVQHGELYRWTMRQRRIIRSIQEGREQQNQNNIQKSKNDHDTVTTTTNAAAASATTSTTITKKMNQRYMALEKILKD